MKSLSYLFLFSLVLALSAPHATCGQSYAEGHITVIFDTGSEPFTPSDQEAIRKQIQRVDQHVRRLLPGLPDTIRITAGMVDWELDIVGGVTGRSDRHAPQGDILIWVSSTYPGGVRAAMEQGLAATLYHEYHHLARGWTMEGNRYGPGIPIAAVNEGLAVVFAEERTGRTEEGNQYPQDVTQWVEEILELPLHADYNQWVSGVHPDGRAAIGYRVGNYLIRTAMKNSGKDIIALSELTPEEILALAGNSWEVPGK